MESFGTICSGFCALICGGGIDVSAESIQSSESALNTTFGKLSIQSRLVTGNGEIERMRFGSSNTLLG